MPRNRTSSPQRFDTNLLDPSRLITRGGLRDALRSVESVCSEDDSLITEMIEELNCQPHIFEYIASNLDSQPFERLSKWVLARFPTHFTPNVMGALGIKLLQRLSSSLTSAEGMIMAGYSSELRGFRRKAALSLDVLEELNECTDLASVGVSPFTTGRKEQKVPAKRLQLDPDPFDCMGIPVPTTDHGARITYGEILLRLKGLLGDYLLFLRKPVVPDLFKRRLKESVAELMTAPTSPSLYFDNLNGFGEWRIFLLTKGQLYLRLEARRGSGGMFGIAMDKMRELSQGHLFGGNKRELTGPEATIPVYEAEITPSVRLVYRIDCIPDGEVETQAICVLGIYKRSKMDAGNLWDTLSQQFEKKGPDHAQRCRLRGISLNDGDDVILPKSFPKSPIQELRKSAPSTTVPEGDLKEVHSVLVLGRFVVLSQALLNSILATQAILEKYGDQIESGDPAELKKVAQIDHSGDSVVREVENFFSSEEEATTFGGDYCSDTARAEAESLRTPGRVFESAKGLPDGGSVVDAIKTLLAGARDRTRLAVEHLVSGLWQHQSFGTDYPTTDSDPVSELLELATTLKDEMCEQEAKEIVMFRARHDGDVKTLRCLHPQFVQTENYPAALLCLDLIFDSTLPSQGNSTVDPGAELPLHLAYFELLDRLRREDSLDPGSIRQRIFAFRPREDEEFFVPENGFLHKIFATRVGIVQENGGYVVSHEELRRVLDREIQEYICLRAKQQHDACRTKLGADPCMRMVTKGECTRHDCQFQHTRPEKMTASWFNVRVQSVLMEIRILNLTGFHPRGVILHWIGVLYSILHPPSPKLGSIASLELGNTPESTEGIRILQEWIWQACDKLLPSTRAQPCQYIETFIPDFMPVCMMAYDFDYGRAQEYVMRTRMYRRKEWPKCLTRPGLATESHFIVRDFVQFLQGGPHHSLILGILFLRQILLNRVPVDIGPFCDTVERLCVLHILAHRFTTGHGSLDDVTSPRSWLTSVFRSTPNPNLGKDTAYLPHFVNDTIELLRRIDSQRESYNPQVVDNHQFKYNGSRLTPLYASAYIARICFCLCLFGYNINDNALRSKVLQVIHGLRGQEGVNPAYRQYAEARDWWGLVLVFTKSLSDSPFDEMILLLHSKAPKYQGWVGRYVRTVTYDNIEEIPDRLRARAVDRPRGRVMEAEDDDERQKQLGLPEVDVLNPNESETIVDNGDQAETPPSPEEIRAVLVIEVAYRRFSKRKREVLKGIDATRARTWSLLHNRVSSMEWSTRRRYRLLMQGPLVNVLVCLDGIKIFADYTSESAKKQLQGADHKRFEELIERSDQSSDLREAAIELLTKLGPLSPFHDNRSASALKDAVLEVGKLIERLSEFPGTAATTTEEGIKEDWRLGWDGIVMDAVGTREGQRPEVLLGEEDILYSR